MLEAEKAAAEMEAAEFHKAKEAAKALATKLAAELQVAEEAAAEMEAMVKAAEETAKSHKISQNKLLENKWEQLNNGSPSSALEMRLDQLLATHTCKSPQKVPTRDVTPPKKYTAQERYAALNKSAGIASLEVV